MLRNCAILALFGTLLFVTLADFSNGQQDGNIIEIDRKARFIINVIRNKKPVVVFFYSKSSCSTCNWNLLPMLEKMVKRRDSIVLAKVDFDVLDIAQEHGVTTIPTTKLYNNGQLEHTAEGPGWGRIVQLVNKATIMGNARPKKTE